MVMLWLGIYCLNLKLGKILYYIVKYVFSKISERFQQVYNLFNLYLLQNISVYNIL